MKKFIIMTASLWVLVACHAQSPDTAKPTSAHQAQTTTSQEKAKAYGVWIDVRTTDEYRAGHLKDSIHVPVEDIAQHIERIEPNKNAPINLYCRSGGRAETARQTLLSMGYTNVTNHGGYDDLIKQGYR